MLRINKSLLIAATGILNPRLNAQSTAHQPEKSKRNYNCNVESNLHPVAVRELNLVLHLPAIPPVEEGGDQAEGGSGEAAQHELDEKCPAFPLAGEEEREEVVEDSFQNAGH